MLDFLKGVRSVLERFSTMEFMGIHIDWFFHLAGATVIVFAVSRFLSLKRALWLTFALLVGKELFDVFAKTKLDYIRPPTVDLAFDMTAGFVGLAMGYLLAKRYPRLMSFRRKQ